MVKPFNPKNVSRMPQQQQINVDLAQCDTACCPCGNPIFRQALMAKILPALMSPSGRDTVINVPLYQCTKCGKAFMPEDMAKFAMTQEQAQALIAEHEAATEE